VGNKIRQVPRLCSSQDRFAHRRCNTGQLNLFGVLPVFLRRLAPQPQCAEATSASIEHRVSSIQHRVSSIQHRVPCIFCSDFLDAAGEFRHNPPKYPLA
jgi:hypothetical protein